MAHPHYPISVLSLKERAYVEVARMSGMRRLDIIVSELMPSLLPYIVAILVVSVSSAVLASIRPEALGLGHLDSPGLGVTIYWNICHSAMLNGWWGWLLPPIVIIVVVFVGHDMGLMAQFVERVGIMYAGRLVEVGPVRGALQEPLYPYAQLLINSVPSFDEWRLMEGISGLTPSMTDLPPGCLFHPRRLYAEEKCAQDVPELVEVRPSRWTACYRPQS